MAAVSRPRFPGAARRAAALGIALVLAGCGGGGAAPEGPAARPEVLSFTSDPAIAHVGDSVRLSASYRGAAARVEPGLGAVVSGGSVQTAALDRDSAFSLVVESPGQPAATRTLAIAVRWRDRYTPLAEGFVASQHTATLAGDGTVLLTGGSRGLGTLSDGVDRYVPADGRMRRIGTLSSGRVQHCATRLADGRILVSGGVHGEGDWRKVELIDERSGAVTATGPLSVPRVSHAALALANGSVLVTGGSTSGEWPRRGYSDSAELWEPATQRFRRLTGRMAMGRAGHSMSLLADGRVLIVGGYTDSAHHVFAELFDPRDETFTAVAGDALPVRAHHAAHVDAQGRVLILGGETVSGGPEAVPVASVLRYEPLADRFVALPPLRTPRSLAGTAMLPSGEVLLIGGQVTPDRYSASAERYDPARGGQPIAALPDERGWHTVTRLASGRVLVVGGEAMGGAYAPTALLYE